MLYLIILNIIFALVLYWWLRPKPVAHFDNLRHHSLSNLQHTRLIHLTSKHQRLQLWCYTQGKGRVLLNGQSYSLLSLIKKIHPQERAAYLANLRQACKQPLVWDIRFRWRCPAGHYLWYSEQGQSWADGQLAGVAQAEQQVINEQPVDTLLFSQSDQACIIFNTQGKILKKNPAYEQMENKLTRSNELQEHFTCDASFWQQLSDQGMAHCLQKDAVQLGFRHQLDAWPMTGSDDQFLGLVRNPRMQQLKEHNFLSYNHPLTGLPNRQSLHHHLQKLSHEKEFQADRLAIIMVNIDHFGQINSLYGQSGGDELLIQVGKRLATLGSPITLVCHLGGDEFALLAEDFHDIGRLRLVGENILNLSRQDFILGNRAILMTASIGIATINQGQLSHSLARGHDALKSARQADGNCLRLLQQDISDIATNAILFEQDLRHAIADQKLELMFQPQFELSSGNIVGAEALLRWPHPEKGLLSAGAFIEIAENSGLIRELGLQVIEMACLSQLALHSSGHACPIAINLSSKQMVDDGLPDYLYGRIQHYQIPVRLISIELTETSLVDNMDSTTRMLERFQELEIDVSLDDFGSGYASFKYLAELPFNFLKIDRSFISPMIDNPRMRDLVSIMIDMAHCMELRVVAEGVENEQQYQALKELECDQAQGFYLGRPMPLSELMLQLEQQQHNTTVRPSQAFLPQ